MDMEYFKIAKFCTLVSLLSLKLFYVISGSLEFATISKLFFFS